MTKTLFRKLYDQILLLASDRVNTGCIFVTEKAESSLFRIGSTIQWNSFRHRLFLFKLLNFYLFKSKFAKACGLKFDTTLHVTFKEYYQVFPGILSTPTLLWSWISPWYKWHQVYTVEWFVKPKVEYRNQFHFWLHLPQF